MKFNFRRLYMIYKIKFLNSSCELTGSNTKKDQFKFDRGFER